MFKRGCIMLISAPSGSIALSQNSSAPERTSFHEKSVSVSNNINISYRDQNNYLQMSMTENVEYLNRFIRLKES